MKPIATYTILAFILTACAQQTNENEDTFPMTVTGKYSQETEYTCRPDLDNIPENYDSIYNCIIENKHLVFPMEDAEFGILIKNNSVSYERFSDGKDYLLDSLFIKKLRALTIDSSNFRWGEIGTPYVDYRMEFYSLESHPKPICYAEFSLDGMLWTFPKLRTTKWGNLTHKGLSKFRRMILEVVND